MKTLAFVLWIAAGSAAAAACNPPVGLTIQQWYGMCAPDIEYYYRTAGQPNGYAHDVFVQQFYGLYLQASQAPAAAATAQACTPGASMCFSGWLRTCQSFSWGTQWITGAQRC